jgi:hypothetical protein
LGLEKTKMVQKVLLATLFFGLFSLANAQAAEVHCKSATGSDHPYTQIGHQSGLDVDTNGQEPRVTEWVEGSQSGIYKFDTISAQEMCSQDRLAHSDRCVMKELLPQDNAGKYYLSYACPVTTYTLEVTPGGWHEGGDVFDEQCRFTEKSNVHAEVISGNWLVGKCTIAP